VSRAPAAPAAERRGPALADAELLELHRRIVAIPSPSGAEGALADELAALLAGRGVACERLGNSLLATVGEGPLLLLDSHLDTVPAGPGWTLPPHEATRRDGRVIGLGSNDAKASVAALLAAFLDIAAARLPFAVALALVEGEETSGRGTAAVLAELERRGTPPVAAVIGEPTGLDLAVAQKGLLVLELRARGEACHAAHAGTLGGRRAVRELVRDLAALEGIDLGPEHPVLGRATLEPTVLRAGEVHNAVPGEALAVLDGRTTPSLPAAEIVARVRARVGGELRVRSDRFRPCATPVEAALVKAAQRVRPGARIFGSATLSDMAQLADIPAIKVGPGRSERSHTADEWVAEEEILDGARFYRGLIAELAAAGSLT